MIHTIDADLILTLALAALFLLAGRWLERRVPLLAKSNIPPAAIGGLAFVLLAYTLRRQGIAHVTVDTTLRAPLQIAFFTTIGMSATLRLLRAGGLRTALFWGIASGTAVVQNVLGAGIAQAMGAPVWLGLICGSLTLTGGPATGLAFTDTFEKLGVPGAGALIIASAMFGILIASLVGNPVATFLIRRYELFKPARAGTPAAAPQARQPQPAAGDPLTAGKLLHNLAVLLITMGIGALLGRGFTRVGVTVPNFIGPMIVAALARWLDDWRGWFRVDSRAMEALGSIALAFFFMIALMELKLWQLAELALPMLVILAAQVVITVIFCAATTFLLMGRDYEAAVMTSGHIGFGLGITANTVVNMDALVARFGPAPQSFLIVPIVGAFFIDLSNSLIITFFLNVMR